MKRILALALAAMMALTALTGCGAKKPAEKTPEELTQLYADAITENGGEMVEYNPVVSAAKEDDGSAMMLEMLGLKPEDMSAFGISLSMMNIKAYCIALIRPAEGKEEAVTEALNGFIETQKASFEKYLADQYEVAAATRLETLSDGSVLMVMCEGQDEIFDAIKTAVEQG